MCFWKDILEMGAAAATILGVPGAIIAYLNAKKLEREQQVTSRRLEMEQREKDREEREYGTYDALDNKYVEFLTLCLQYPELKINEGVDPENAGFTEAQQQQRQVILEILICTLERAYLMYNRHKSEIRTEQWRGWELYIEYWMTDKSFRSIWDDPDFQRQYSASFVDFMRTKK